MRIRLIFLALVGASLALGSPAGTAAQPQGCPGSPPARLLIGELGQVTGATSNNLRESPATAGKLIRALAPGAVFSVLAGPTCAENYAWWQVEAQGQKGWTVEAVGKDYALLPLKRFAAEGVSFAYDPALVPAGISVKVVPDSGGNQFWPQPDSLNVTLIPERPYDAVLEIYPRRAYGLINPYVADEIAELAGLLKDRPAIAGGMRLPRVAHRGSAQIVTARPAYIPFEGGIGVRYLAAYAQNTIPILRTTLRYIVAGLTSDGKYLVKFTFPVSAGSLPEKDNENETDDFRSDDSGAKYRAYLNKVIGIVEKAADTSFSPAISALDGQIGSLSIGAVLTESVTRPDRFGRSQGVITQGEVAACAPPAPAARLSVGAVARPALPVNVADFLLDAPAGENVGMAVGASDLVLVLDGPICVENTNWWLVYAASRKASGWLAETGRGGAYSLTPVSTSAASLKPPDLAPGQAVTACKLVPLRYAAWYTRPNAIIESERGVFLVNGATYYADALLKPEEGGYWWWRLTPGAKGMKDGREQTAQTAVWVNANQVSESAGCLSLPILAR